MSTVPTVVVPFPRPRATVLIHPQVMESLAAYAEQVGLPVEEYVEQILVNHLQFVRKGSGFQESLR